MKNVLIALLLMAFIPAAAPFEGTVRYTIEVDGDLGAMAAMMPKYYEYSFKDSNVKMKSDAAMMGEILIRGNDNLMYMIQRSEKVAYKMDMNAKNTGQEVKPKVSKTNETATIAGYKCHKYTVEVPGQDLQQVIWATPDFTVARPKNASKAPMGDFFTEGIDGFPLKMDANMQGIKMTMTASEIKPAKLNAADFELPAGFAVKELNLSSMFGN
jgi:hypothetical protein